MKPSVAPSAGSPSEQQSTEMLIDFVTRWAADTPAAAAARYGSREWSWTQWHDRIRRVAGGLRAAGIRRGDRIAFLDKNHPACLEVTFAAASQGVAVAILNWRLAEDELAYALTDSGARILFVGTEFIAAATAAISSMDVAPFTIGVGEDGDDDYEAFISASEAVDADPDATPADAALIVYSSGTTGRPKGVVMGQRALVAHTVDVGTRFPFAAGDSNLVAMPLFHVGGICYAFFGIRAGVLSVVTRTADPATLIAGLAQGVTHTFLVPAVINGFVDGGRAAVDALGRLKILGYGAAPMPLPLLRRALATWPMIDFVQVYGQTELSGVAATLLPADHRDPDRAHVLVSAGTPVPGVEIRVADIESGAAVAPGQQGELWFRTSHAMTGYLNRPEATAETITADGWVRTGDIGRVDAEGYVYVEDRLKDMIITGGENVYGPEVERVLISHPAIVDAAIIGVPDDRWGESVKAIVVTAAPTTADDVIAFCRDRLAGYKCPRTVDFLSELPRNASGKVLKRELRQPYWAGRDRAV